MSKLTLLALANVNLFVNTNEKVEFSISKDQRVQAQYSGYDKAKGYDIRGVRAKSAAGKGFIRLSFSLIDDQGQRAYFNGALFKNDKKSAANQPDMQGSLNLDNKTDGPKLRLAAWKKVGEKAGDYLSIAIQEFQAQTGSGTGANSGAFDVDDVPVARSVPAAPAARPAPAAVRPVPATPVARPAPARTGAAQPAGFDDFQDDDIPFAHCFVAPNGSASNKASKMDRYK